MVFSRPGLVWEAEIINSVLLLLAGWWYVCTLYSLFVVESLFLTWLVLLAPFFFLVCFYGQVCYYGHGCTMPLLFLNFFFFTFSILVWLFCLFGLVWMGVAWLATLFESIWEAMKTFGLFGFVVIFWYYS